MDERSETPWFAAGLRFGCTRCGTCCTGEPGTVRVTGAELRALARRLGMDEAAFRERFTYRLPGGERSLREEENGDCVFFDRRRGCTVYQDRPRQCRTWPFWRSIVATRKRWDAAARDCPGMNRGPLHDGGTILRTSAQDGTSGALPGLAESDG